ncbi:cation:proton antiporter [Streptomyces sp. NBC_01218]|uniref:cation:proton antiporter n=1 Tax=Streptomyces sp. NBC_01218 TaxID=2903780 RepID=UPI002E15A4CC|nr:cation:proton antiporter [Streptomyces sp. NBC_01218]
MAITTTGAVYGCLGLGALLAAVLPRLLSRRPVSPPMVFLASGLLVYALPLPLPLPEVNPTEHRAWAEHLTELCVIASLMGAGLAINRPFGWRTWRTTWRLLGVAMPLAIGATALVAYLLLDWPPYVALLLAAVLAPTDPVLASEVRVGEPTDDAYDEDEVRFALTSEAGLNDGLAFPFVLGALALGATGEAWSTEWLAHWAWSDVLVRLAVGVAVGVGTGLLLGRVLFHAGAKPLRLAEHGEGFVALAVTLTSYGLAESLHGYGFLAVFAAACTLRSRERGHQYHQVLHEFIEQIERLLMAVLLFATGAFIATGALSHLTWRGAATGLLLHLLIRPLTSWLALVRGPAARKERLVTSFLGIRGIGSFFYLAYACGRGEFGPYEDELWAIVVFTVLVSVVLHGASAAPITAHLDRENGTDPDAPESGDGLHRNDSDSGTVTDSSNGTGTRTRTDSSHDDSDTDTDDGVARERV